ncbi:MAG: T9SS type A sorting domain-containing protein, partial [Calditrichia bacterium]
ALTYNDSMTITTNDLLNPDKVVSLSGIGTLSGNNAPVILAAQIGGDSQYRSFWVNGSWDSSGVYNSNWTGPMVELKDDGVAPDAAAGDNIFTGSVVLAVDNTNTYNWWTGSENDVNSFLDDGTGFNVTSAATVYPDTLVVDGDGGINEWVIALAGSFNGWNNADDMVRGGMEWTKEVALEADSTYEYKYPVMHQWNAAYGSGGIGGAGSNYSFTAPEDGMYKFTFNDADHSQMVELVEPGFFDDFDSYTAGVQLVSQNPIDWTTWSGLPGSGEDPFVSDAHAYSGSNSVVIAQNNDLVKVFAADPFTSGMWKLSWQMYIPTGGAGYFNTLADFAGGSSEFAMQVYFDAGGTGRLDAGGASAATFNYAYDAWQPVAVIVDLDNDLAEFWLDGTMIYSWQWTLGTFGTTTIPLQMDANDFFGATAVDEMYIDDYDISEYVPPVPYFDDFDSYTAGVQLALQNPTSWTTWSGLPGSGEDAYVSDAHSYSGSNSVVVAQNNDLVKTFGGLTSGEYKISFQVYIPTGKAGYFNTLAGFAPNPNNWGMEAYFDAGGGGRLFGGSATAVNFSYANDTWQQAEVIVDLDNDMAQFRFDGTIIHTWQWTLGASGGTSPLQLDANDFFGATADDEMYFDDYYVRADTTVITGIGDGGVQVPKEFALYQNYPNPFNPTTTIRYDVKQSTEVKLVIYNMLGQEVRTLVNNRQDAGYKTVVWDGLNNRGSRVASGIYIYRLQAGDFVQARKMILMK